MEERAAIEKKARRDRTGREMEDLLTRRQYEVAMHGGVVLQRSQYYSCETYGEGYQDARATMDHHAMVQAPEGRMMVSNRLGVDEQGLSPDGQAIYTLTGVEV